MPERIDARPLAPAAWFALDDFEDPAWPDPGLWRLPTPPDSSWAPSACQARHGARSLRAFAGPRGAPEPPCGAPVAAEAVSRATMILDLRAAQAASRIDLYFDLWLLMPAGEDQGLFIYLVVPQAGGSARRVPVFGGTGMGGLWAYPRRLDLLNLDDITVPDKPYDLRGGVWELEWTAYAPRGVPAGGGIYVDNVALVWEPDPALPTPTPWITMTPVATASPTHEPTPTRRPSLTPTETPPPSPTATVDPHPWRLYLPLAGLDGPPVPTETPVPTEPPPTVTGTPPTATETPPTATEAPPTATEAQPTASGTPPTPTGTLPTPTATPPIGPMDWHLYLPLVQPSATSA